MAASFKNWSKITLGDECIIERGISWNRDQETTETDGAWAVLTIPNIKERLDLSSMTHIREVSAKAAERATASVGYTILIGSNGNKQRVGDCCYINQPMKALYASFLMGLTPRP